MTTPPNPPSGDSAFKSRGGLRRIFNAARYSLAGFRAAFRHEAAFRQELVLGIPMLLLAGSVVAVWIVELLNSAVEALADTISTEHHPMLGRAKDIGSAAVMLALVFAGVVWTVILWPAK